VGRGVAEVPPWAFDPACHRPDLQIARQFLVPPVAGLVAWATTDHRFSIMPSPDHLGNWATSFIGPSQLKPPGGNRFTFGNEAWPHAGPRRSGPEVLKLAKRGDVEQRMHESVPMEGGAG